MKSQRFSVSRRTLIKSLSASALLGGTMLSPLAALANVPPKAKNSIRVLSVEDPFYFAMRALIPEYEKQAGVKVELESLSYDALQARLAGAFLAKTSDADVITVDQMWLGQYLDNGWITPLNDMLARDKEIDLADFIPEALYSTNIWKGQIGTLPVAAYAQGVLYHKDILAAHGIKPPPENTRDDWTWDAYMNALQGLKGKTFNNKPLFPTVICGSQPSPIVHMFSQLSASFGANWFTSFPRAPWNFQPTMSGPVWEKAIDYYRQLYRLSPPESINYVWFDAGTRFAQGDIAMFYWWSPYFYLVKNSGYMTGKKSIVADHYGIGALPRAKDAPQRVSMGGWSLGLASTSDNQQGGFDFIKWATSKITQKKMALWPDLNYQFSDFARQSLYQDEELRKVYPYLPVQYNMMKQGDGKVSRPPVPGYSALENMFGMTLNQLLTNTDSAADALGRVEGMFESVLKGNMLIPYTKKDYNDTLDEAKALITRLAN